jgi:hypothetical protein
VSTRTNEQTSQVSIITNEDHNRWAPEPMSKPLRWALLPMKILTGEHQNQRASLIGEQKKGKLANMTVSTGTSEQNWQVSSSTNEQTSQMVP